MDVGVGGGSCIHDIQRNKTMPIKPFNRLNGYIVTTWSTSINEDFFPPRRIQNKMRQKNVDQEYSGNNKNEIKTSCLLSQSPSSQHRPIKSPKHHSKVQWSLGMLRHNTIPDQLQFLQFDQSPRATAPAGRWAAWARDKNGAGPRFLCSANETCNQENRMLSA